MRVRRPSVNNLTVDERRVLEAFFCGRLTAGQLSKALARARAASEPATARPVASVEPVAVAEPAPLAVAA